MKMHMKLNENNIQYFVELIYLGMGPGLGLLKMIFGSIVYNPPKVYIVVYVISIDQ